MIGRTKDLIRLNTAAVSLQIFTLGVIMSRLQQLAVRGRTFSIFCDYVLRT